MKLAIVPKQKAYGRDKLPLDVGKRPESGMNRGVNGRIMNVCINSKHPLAVQMVTQIICANFRRCNMVTFERNNSLLADGTTDLPILILDSCSIAQWPDVLLRQLSSGGRAVVIMLEDLASRIQHCSLFRAGICGIVSISADLAAELPAALLSAAQGATWVSKALRERTLVNDSPRTRFHRYQTLTAREEQMVILLREGLTNRQIGTILGTSERTVKFHVSNSMKKLRVADRLGVQGLVASDGLQVIGTPNGPGRRRGLATSALTQAK